MRKLWGGGRGGMRLLSLFLAVWMGCSPGVMPGVMAVQTEGGPVLQTEDVPAESGPTQEDAPAESGPTEEDVPAESGPAEEDVLPTENVPPAESVPPVEGIPAEPMAAPAGPDLIAIAVTAEWIGGSAQARPASATVTLTSIPQTQQPSRILDETSGWSCLWRDLPVKTDQGTKITYYVNETPMTDVTNEQKSLTALTDIWVPADTLTGGEEYLVVQTRTPILNEALAATTNPQYISAAGVTMGGGFTNEAERFGVTAASANCRWNAVPSGGTQGEFYLQNGSSYLCQNVDAQGSPTTLGTSPTAQTVFTYTDQGHLRSDGGTYVMRNDSQFSATTDVTQATKLALYRRVPADQSILFVNNFQPKDPALLGPVDYHKRIDYLGDGQGNPDTRRGGRDDYRLYLDVASGIQMPADLVLVLDASGSMDAARMKILSEALMGADGKDGFIARFLRADPRNQLSIVYFWGASVNSRTRGVNWATDNPLSGGNIRAGQDVGDATIYENWMTSARLPYAPPLLKKGSGGTNYGAGLYWAQQLLHRRAASTATQYMVFMSDGVPTHGLSKNVVSDTAGLMTEGTVFGRDYEAVPEALKNSAGIYRYGTGGGAPQDPFNESFCKKANMVLARNFAASNPTLNIFSVGVGVTDPEVLQNLASGTGRYIRAENMGDLDGAFSSILGPTGVVISDKLSDYVDFGAGEPEVKLTAQCGKTQTVLYEKNAVTPAGAGVLQSVAVDAVTKKVTATFVPTFTLAPNTVYTLSFNVTTTPLAYEEYHRAQGYPVRGETDTDYGQNATSSGRPGFYANDNAKATLTYAFGAGGTPVTKWYQKPVVQVDETPHFTLPVTGGGGTTGFFLLGGGLVLTAAFLLRRAKEGGDSS